MKEHKDGDVVTDGGKQEGLFGDDVMVDVVDEPGKKEDVGVVEVVVKEVIIQESVVTTVASGTVSGEVKESEADGDHVLADKKDLTESKGLGSSKIQGSTEGRVVVKEGLVGKDKDGDGVKNQASSNVVVNVNVGTEKTDSQDGADQMKKESVQSTIEGATKDSKKSGNGTHEAGDTKMVVELDKGGTEETVERPAESVQDAANVDSVISEKNGKDEILEPTNIPDLMIEADEVITEEGIAGQDEIQEDVCEEQNSVRASEPSLSSKIDDTGTSEGLVVENAENLDQSTEVVLVDKEEGSQLTVDVEMHNASKSGKETTIREVAVGDRDSSKIKQPSIMASLGLEEEDVVVVDEGLEGKNEPQDRVSVEPSLVNLNEVGQKAEVDSADKDESSFATIKPGEKEPSSEQISADGGIFVENKRIDINAVTDSSEPECVIITMTPVTVGHHSRQFQADQGLNANQGNEITSADIKVPTTGMQDVILPATTDFSYEDAHMERGDEAGMDIDEVLSWKDEIPSVQQEDVQNVDPTPVTLRQSYYFHPPEKEGEFSVSDLVWGKVRSHPWWPGQIFDLSDASEKAMKHHKEDCFLVAYFGDRTFGWNESTVLKPFRENFSQVLEHMDSEAFNNAVHCALQEVSRRVELGLTCSCIPRDIYENIKYQIVDNSGIKQEASRRHGVDKSASVNSFVPDMLVDYVRLLAKFPYDAGDKMELTMAKAQLSSYGRFKGHRQLAEFQSCGDLLEVEHAVKDETYTEDGSKKRKAVDSFYAGSEKRPTPQTEMELAKLAAFKVGGYDKQVASQLPGPPVQEDMLSQHHFAAQDPMKGYGFVNTIIPFFNVHPETVMNNSIVNSSNDVQKRKPSNGKEFEFDDVNDSYWTDRIVQNHPEENQNGNGGGEHQIMYEQEIQPVKPARRSNKKRFFNSNHEIEAKEQSELMERRRKNLATEVLMKFAEGVYFPSEIHINKMFRRFGPLMESETEVDRQGGRARVVFKKCSDAEVAHNSAGKFNIFGSINVNYELNYAPLISYKPLPLPLEHDPAHGC